MINKLYLLFLMVFFSSYFQSLVDEDPLPTLEITLQPLSLYQVNIAWEEFGLSMYRGSTKEHSDPLMRTYLEDLIYRLSETSEVRDRRFESIILEDKTINAFVTQEE